MHPPDTTDEEQSVYPSFLRLARVVRAEHVPGVDGWCTVCRDPREMSPCPPARIALRLFPLPAEPDFWARADMLAVLAVRDVAGLFGLLQRHGISQRRIASYTQQSQSEVSEILAGRRVESYGVLVRIAEGLGIPRGYMGLAYADLPAASTLGRP